MIAATQTTHAPTVDVLVTSATGQTVQVKAIPDTGADISAAGPGFIDLLNGSLEELAPTTERPESADGSPMRVLGSISVTLTIGEHSVQTPVLIVDRLKGLLLSWETTRHLALIPTDFPKQIARVPSQQVTNHLSARDRLIADFPKVFDGVLRVMPGEVFTIQLKDGARPFCVNTPRRVPFAYREPLKEQLDTLTAQGIIAPVTAPSQWCSPIVVVPKKSSDEVRLCVDFTQLNKFIVREGYQSPTPHECVASIQASKAKVFSSFDALKGYHQCPLDAASQELTTFITPFGRFKYLRAPFGLSSIAEHYNRRMAEAFDDLDDFQRIVDDVVVYDATREVHEQHVRGFLQRCSDRGISLNAEKFKFAEDQLKFAGFILTDAGYQIDPALTAAIAKFPTPQNVTDLRSFMGLVNQLGTFTPNLAGLVEPLRTLLSSKSDFLWTENHQQAFETARTMLSTPPALQYFDGNKPLSLHTDASRLNGLGFVLRQKVDGDWRVVQAGSRFLTDTESRYATIELEMLAVAWAVRKCHLFLAGLDHFAVITDHKPLLPILNSHRLDEIENPRLQRLRRRLMEYAFVASWCQGKKHSAADALSRAPVSVASEDDELAEDRAAQSIRQVLTGTLDAEQLNLRLEAVQQATDADPEMQALQDTIQRGFPTSKADLPSMLHPYWNARDALTVENGLILHGCRLVIPSSMRRRVLQELHDSHQGIERTKARACQTVYWPSINNDITNTVRSCADCQRELPSLPREPLMSHAEPSRPFEVISMDLGTYANQQFLIAVDHFSSWPWVFQLGASAITRQITASLCDIFCASGAPDIIYTDQGTQFMSKECQDFFKRWGVRHVTSSPHFPQSNGRAEAAVKSMKKIIRRTWDAQQRRLNKEAWTRALVQYRNTPGVTGLSPAQRLFGHPLQDLVPAHRRSFAPEWQQQADVAERRQEATQERLEARYNRTARALPVLEVGTRVAVQDSQTKLWDRYGTIVDIGRHRNYFVRMNSGRVLVRNRRALRRRYAVVPTPLTQPSTDLRVEQADHDMAEKPRPPQPLRRSRRTRRPRDRLIEHDDI